MIYKRTSCASNTPVYLKQRERFEKLSSPIPFFNDRINGKGRGSLLSDIQDKNNSHFRFGPQHHKIQRSCCSSTRISIDTERYVCNDKINNVEVPKSPITMCLWYRNPSLTITYLSDVSNSSTSGRLADLREFLTSLAVIFSTKYWTLYDDDDRSSDHNEVRSARGGRGDSHRLTRIGRCSTRAVMGILPEDISPFKNSYICATDPDEGRTRRHHLCLQCALLFSPDPANRTKARARGQRTEPHIWHKSSWAQDLCIATTDDLTERLLVALSHGASIGRITARRRNS